MAESASDGASIRTASELRRHFEAGEKPAAHHRLGVEHEKIPVLADGRAPAYDEGIGDLLSRVSGATWSVVEENGVIVGLRRKTATGSSSVSLEPGGQIEHSDAPRASAVEARDAIVEHLRELAAPASALGLTLLGVGFRPFGTLDDVPWMPKGRYRVMRAYLPRRGALAHEMMKRTATVQVNLDYADQADCAANMRAAMGCSPLVTALFAASPLVDGRATDYQSYRAAAWLHTDPDRCGLLPFVFDERAEERLYDDYVAWALDVPMFFVHRRGEYVPADGIPFRRFLAEGFRGEHATWDDWELHLSTLFPEVRLKQYIEMRSADGGRLPLVFALPALYRGLLYERQARAATLALTAAWTMEEREALRREVPRLGLRARVRGVPIGPLCQELVAIARDGLHRLGAPEDAGLLEPLERVAAEGRTTADELRDLHQRHGGDVGALIHELALPI